MCHDRTDIELTHDYLAITLAVRRPSVTAALHILEGKRLIVSARGTVSGRDREAWEMFAAGAYGPYEREYRRLFGPLR